MVRFMEQIYKYRCMTVLQLYRCFYSNSEYALDEFFKNVIYPAIYNEQIELFSIEGSQDFMIFLKTKGLNLLKNSGVEIPYQAGQLRVSKKLFKHQVELVNCFLDIEEFISEKWHVVYEVFYDKFTYKFGKVYPDGLISTPDINFFIEIDMGTERTNKLEERVFSYANYMYSTKSNKKIVVLFVMHNAANSRMNKMLELTCANKTLLLSNKIEFSILPPENIIKSIKYYIASAVYLEKAKKVFVSLGFKIISNQTVLDYGADFYAYKTDKDKLLYQKHNNLSHYFAVYCPYPFSVERTANLASVNLKRYIQRHGKNINLLIITPVIDEAVKKLILAYQSNHYSLHITDLNTMVSKINEVCP